MVQDGIVPTDSVLIASRRPHPAPRFTPSAADVVQAAACYFAPALVKEQGMTRVIQAAREFPAAFTYGFEFRLGEEAAATDFSLAFGRSQQESRILSGAHPNIDLSERLRAQPAWQAARALLGDWLGARGAPWQGVEYVWLEFDTASSDQAVQSPSIFFSTGHGADRRGLALALAERLQGGSGATAACLEKVFSSPYAQESLFQIGTMLARTGGALRLCLGLCHPLSIVPFLREIGWPGPLPELTALLDQLVAWGARLSLQIDVGDAVGPKVGVECYAPSGERILGQTEAWRPMLDGLVAAGLCLPQKRDALLAWVGGHRARLLWTRRYGRRVSHLKLVYQVGRPLQAKAYAYLWEEIQERGGGFFTSLPCETAAE